MKTKDFPISQLRLVDVLMRGNHIPSTYMMHESQVETFIKATIRLHHTHGNPHTKSNPENLWEIRVDQLTVEAKSYWWCCEDLQNNNDPKGAQLNHSVHSPRSRRVWAHPDLIAEEKKRRAEEEQAEYEDEMRS